MDELDNVLVVQIIYIVGAHGHALKDNRWKKKYKAPACPETKGLPPIPDKWTWATLLQLGELNRGKSKHRPRNDSKLYDGSYPFVQLGNLQKVRKT